MATLGWGWRPMKIKYRSDCDALANCPADLTKMMICKIFFDLKKALYCRPALENWIFSKNCLKMAIFAQSNAYFIRQLQFFKQKICFIFITNACLNLKWLQSFLRPWRSFIWPRNTYKYHTTTLILVKFSKSSDSEKLNAILIVFSFRSNFIIGALL